MVKFRRKAKADPNKVGVVRRGTKRIGSVMRHEPFAITLPKKDEKHFLNKRRGLIPTYFRESWSELRKVRWPKRKEAWKLTIAVFIFSTLFAAMTAAADYGFTKLAERIFLK